MDSQFASTGWGQWRFADQLQQTDKSHSRLQLSVDVSQLYILLQVQEVRLKKSAFQNHIGFRQEYSYYQLYLSHHCVENYIYCMYIFTVHMCVYIHILYISAYTQTSQWKVSFNL